MKRLRTLLMVLAMALCLSGLSFAAEAGAIEPIDDGSVAAPQLYAERKQHSLRSRLHHPLHHRRHPAVHRSGAQRFFPVFYTTGPAVPGLRMDEDLPRR